MEYLQNYVQEDVKMIQSMEGETPEKILERDSFCPGEGFLADSQSVCVYYDREPQTAGSL